MVPCVSGRIYRLVALEFFWWELSTFSRAVETQHYQIIVAIFFLESQVSSIVP